MQTEGESSTANDQTETGAKMSKDKNKQSVEYDVESIIFHEVINGSLVYLIKWTDCGMDECTWEPEKNLKHCKKILSEYKTTKRLL
ncbi:heterochromatin protein 1 [Melanaphis sacchari]|uniref:heterochromatin protein 1 n=1 Tax=Melanaphis sacchari TaxID=742174 RepID=UPI000DC13A19|nr:heterochromatin protein 1 [Melanaphis sacchari]